MTEFESRHINCFETLVGIVLGILVYSMVMGAGAGLMLIPAGQEFFLAMAIIVFIFATAAFVLYIIKVANEYSKVRDSFIAQANVNKKVTKIMKVMEEEK